MSKKKKFKYKPGDVVIHCWYNNHDFDYISVITHVRDDLYAILSKETYDYLGDPFGLLTDNDIKKKIDE